MSSVRTTATPPRAYAPPRRRRDPPRRRRRSTRSLWSKLRGTVARHEAPLLASGDDTALDDATRRELYGSHVELKPHDATRRHSFGPDPWDRACLRARTSFKSKLSAVDGAADDPKRHLADVVVEYHRLVRGLLVDYVREIGNLGLVYRVQFPDPGPLHFQVALARDAVLVTNPGGLGRRRKRPYEIARQKAAPPPEPSDATHHPQALRRRGPALRHGRGGLRGLRGPGVDQADGRARGRPAGRAGTNVAGS